MTKLEAFQCYFVTKFYPPPPNRHLFLKVKMMISKSYCFEAYWPNRRPSTGGAASPGSSSMSRREQHAQGEQHAKREQLTPPPQTFTLFLKVKMMISKSYCFEAYWPNRRPSTGEAASPGSSNMFRRKQHAQGEQHAKGSSIRRVDSKPRESSMTRGSSILRGAACPG